MDKIVDFFIHEKRTHSESLIKYRTRFINIIGCLIIVVTFTMSFVRFFREDYFVGFVDLLLSLVILYMIYLLKIKPYYLTRIIQVFVSLIFVFTFIIITSVDYDAKLALPFMFLSAAVFLQGKRAGFFWFIVIFLEFVVLYYSPILGSKFSNITIIMMMAFLVCHYIVLLLYENQQRESSEKLEKVNRDLDQTVQARTKELYDQKEAFETLYNKASDGVLLIQDGQFIDCNESVVKMLKYSSKEEFLNTHPSELSPKLQPDGNSSLTKADEMIRLCLQNSAHSFEWVHQKSDGQQFWCEVVLTKLKLQEKETIHVVWRDISKRKALEEDISRQAKTLEEFNATLEEKVKHQVRTIQESLENFKILIDSTIEAIFVYDYDKGIIDCNKMGLKLFQYDRDEILGKDIFEFIYKDDIELVKENFKLDHASPYEVRALNAKGLVIPILISGANMQYNGELVRVITIFDLSELKQKDKLLQQQSRHATMGEMIGMIAHQWRQPLAAISGSVGVLNIDLMMDQYDKDAFQAHVDKIGEHTQFLSSTIDDFRNFFKEHKQKSDTTLNEITQSALKIIEPTLLSQKIEIVKRYNSCALLHTHANELRQVVLNLLKNAQDAMLESSVENPKIEILTYDEDNHSILEISDNGGGIPEDVIENIFEPYFTTREKKDGTGLGLYMSKTIVSEHCQGSITVSNDDQGARFKIKLEKT